MSDSEVSSIKPCKSHLLDLTVFLCGALVMIYEINGSRILSPFIGSSSYIWTSLIGVILAALSFGCWLGGKTADRNPDIKTLASVIFSAGGFVSLTILLDDLILAIIAQSPIRLEIKATVAAILLFAPASILLGFVAPYVVRLKISSLADSGKTVGRLYALSTVGSILGTFLAGFFLIPLIGSIRTLYLIAAALIGLSILLAPFALTRLNIAILILFIFGVSTSELNSYYLLQKADLRDIDTEYSRVQIFKTTDPESGKPIRALAFDPYFFQSAMFLDSDELALEYAEFYHLIRHFKPDFQKTLMIGGAGYSFPKEYLRKYPNAEMDVVEIDSQMTEIAKKYFRLEENPRLNIIHEDGRVFLNRTAAQKYDAVLLDAFSSLFSVPFQLTTVEAVRHINRVLKDDGIVIFNLGGAIEGKSSRFFQAEFKTYQQVFPHVLLFKVGSDKKNSQVQNLIIVACKTEISSLLESRDAEITRLLSHYYEAQSFENEQRLVEIPVLIDDLAPVEYYNSFAQNVP